MPYWSYKCDDCGHETTLHAVSHEKRLDELECAWCRGTMKRQPSAPNFQVTGYNAKNGYGK